MGLVRLSLLEAEERLPPVCMVCGNEAQEVVHKKLSWSPGWVWLLLLVGLLPFLIVALILTKRAVLEAPLCSAHKNHWSKRTLLLVLSFLGLFGLVFVGILAEGKPWQSVLLLGCLFGFLVWVVVAIVVSLTAVRPRSITDSEIVLVNVSPRFIDALVDFDTEEDERPRRRRPLRGWQIDSRIQEDKPISPDERFQD